MERSVTLELVDVTNLATPETFHVIGYRLRPGRDRLTLSIRARVGESVREEVVELERLPEPER